MGFRKRHSDQNVPDGLDVACRLRKSWGERRKYVNSKMRRGYGQVVDGTWRRFEGYSFWIREKLGNLEWSLENSFKRR